MPQLGETVTEGTITRWLKQVGDPIAVDDVLFEVSTDKVDTEVPSAFAGVLRQILVPEGDTVADRHAARRHHRRPPTRPARAEPPPRRAAARAESSPRPQTHAPADREPHGWRPVARPPRPAAERRSCRRSCGRCSTSTAWSPATSSGRGATGASPAATCWRPRPTAGRAGTGRGRRRGTAAPVALPAGRGRRRRRGRRVHPGPAQHRRAHDPVAGHVGPHARGDRGRLPRASTASAGRRSSRSCRSWPAPSSTPSASSRTSTPRSATTS